MEIQNILSTLESIGLSHNEATVYLDLVKVGKSSAMDVSKRTGIHRSNTYDIVERLLEKGIVDKSLENGKTFFYPVDPDDLLEYLKQKEKDLGSIIPEINKIQGTIKEEQRVSLSEGLNSVKNILDHLLDFKKPIVCYGIPKESVEILGGFIGEFHRKRIKRKILLRAIYDSKALSFVRKLNEMDFTEARFLPMNHPEVSTLICGDKVILVVWDSPATAIIIRNSKVAESYLDYFEILWREAEVNIQ